MVSERRLKEVRKRLLLRRRWAYLRYLNLREAFLKTQGVVSVLAVGCGHGLAELALALEFPDTHFHLTDIVATYGKSKQLVDAWKVGNVTFGIRDILEPAQDQYDLVTSIEVLDQIENDRLAAAEMRASANNYVFALVPFIDKGANGNEGAKLRLQSENGSYRAGYDEQDLRELFPGVVDMQGCFWTSRGLEWRRRLESLSDQEIMESQDELEQVAAADLMSYVPKRRSQACGIWVLARA